MFILVKFVPVKLSILILSSAQTYNPIIFYDGDCGFCNSTVQFILNKKKKEFYFVALQSERAKKILGQKEVTIKMDTIYYLHDNRLYTKSSAALQICKRLKGAYPLLFAFYIIPKFLRDPFYNFIAKRRHKIRAGYCLLPIESDRKYFLTDN